MYIHALLFCFVMHYELVSEREQERTEVQKRLDNELVVEDVTIRDINEKLSYEKILYYYVVCISYYIIMCI